MARLRWSEVEAAKRVLVLPAARVKIIERTPCRGCPTPRSGILEDDAGRRLGRDAVSGGRAGRGFTPGCGGGSRSRSASAIICPGRARFAGLRDGPRPRGSGHLQSWPFDRGHAQSPRRPGTSRAFRRRHRSQPSAEQEVSRRWCARAQRVGGVGAAAAFAASVTLLGSQTFLDVITQIGPARHPAGSGAVEGYAPLGSDSRAPFTRGKGGGACVHTQQLLISSAPQCALPSCQTHLSNAWQRHLNLSQAAGAHSGDVHHSSRRTACWSSGGIL